MFKLFFRVLVCLLPVAGGYGAWRVTHSPHKPAVAQPRQQQELSRDVLALAKNVYWEALAAKEPESSARMVAYVTHNRAKKNRPYWGGSDIYKVVYKRASVRRIHCQFSWVCKKQAKTPIRNGRVWRKAVEIAQDELAGKFVPPKEFADATSYINEKAAKSANVCEFKTKLIYIGKLEKRSKHEFYREPTNEKEKASLPKPSEVTQCGTSRTSSFFISLPFLYVSRALRAALLFFRTLGLCGRCCLWLKCRSLWPTP